MKTNILQFNPALRTHPTRDTFMAVWFATGNPRQPLACVWIDRDSQSGLAENAPPEMPLPRARSSENESRATAA